MKLEDLEVTKKLVAAFIHDVNELMQKFHIDSKGGLITSISIEHDFTNEDTIGTNLKAGVKFPIDDEGMIYEED